MYANVYILPVIHSNPPKNNWFGPNLAELWWEKYGISFDIKDQVIYMGDWKKVIWTFKRFWERFLIKMEFEIITTPQD